MSTTPSPFGSNRGGGGSNSSFMYILIGVLGLGAIVFAILTITFYNKASVATNTLEQQKADAVTKAKAEQQKADDEANTIANESPFRSYVAPVEYGSFEIKFPKNWSGWVDHEQVGTQVNLVLNPDFVRRINSNDELAAAKVMLKQNNLDQTMSAFTSLVKRGTLKQTEITVSGQKGVDLTGSFSDKRTTREVIIPVRDKTIIFINENNRYASEFNEILAQSKIIP